MRYGLWVEELRVSYNDTYQIRITLCFQSIRLNKYLTFDRVERTVNNEQIRRAIADAVMQLFEEAAERAIEHLYVNVRRTGHWDNMRGAFESRAMEPPPELRADYDYYRYLHGDWAPLPKINKKKDEVERKAMSLLFKAIGKEKAKQLKEHGYFEVQGKHGIFRFMKDDPGGVKLIEKKKYGLREREIIWSLCIQSSKADMPKGDVILSRYLDFMADENKFLETANFRTVSTLDEATTRR